MQKVNLIYGKGDVFDTHLNINPFAEEEIENKIIRSDVTNLDKHIDDGELDELLAYDVIDYISITDAESCIANWVKKLRVGGKICVGGTDLIEVCKSFSQYRVDITTANELIHGSQEKPYLIKKINFTCIGMCEYLESHFGLNIIKKSVNNYKMIVEAVR
tara:strand:+ start:32 stop:511 length:480 start_codon:yes stop_codon:yes gene_type:complete